MGRFNFQEICEINDGLLGVDRGEGNLSFYKLVNGKFIYIPHDRIVMVAQTLIPSEKAKFDRYVGAVA